MAQTTGNSANIVKQQIYGEILQESFKEDLLGLLGMNDLTSEFPVGDTFNVDQIGQATLSEYTENTDIDFSAIDTSRITLALTDYPGDGFYVTDKLKLDAGGRADRLWSTRVKESAYAFGKRMEGDLYSAASATQTPNDANAINGQAHRFTHSGSQTAQDLVNDIADMKLAFDKASVPQAGRILIVDSTVENLLNKLGTGAVIVSDSPRFEGLLTSGFVKGHVFLRTIHGFDLFTSELLPLTAATEFSVSAGSHINIAMSIADEDSKPMMGVIRQHPTAAMERNESKKRDEWSSTAYYGFALYRPESIICYTTKL